MSLPGDYLKLVNVILSEDALAGSRAPVLRAAGCHRASESKDPHFS
jgi:hypothetical protein